MEKINVRNVYIDLLNKIKNVEGVDKDYVDGLVDVIDQQLTSIESDLNALISIIPEEASVTDPLVIDSDLAAVAKSGSYSDLSNTPTIPAAQVNSDWSSSSGVSEILNKPTVIIPVYKEVVIPYDQVDPDYLDWSPASFTGKYNYNIPFTLFQVKYLPTGITPEEKAAFNLITSAILADGPSDQSVFTVHFSNVPTTNFKVGMIIYQNQ